MICTQTVHITERYVMHVSATHMTSSSTRFKVVLCPQVHAFRFILKADLVVDLEQRMMIGKTYHLSSGIFIYTSISDQYCIKCWVKGLITIIL